MVTEYLSRPYRLIALGFAGDVLALAGMAGAIATISGGLLAAVLALGNLLLVGGTVVAYRGWTRLEDRSGL